MVQVGWEAALRRPLPVRGGARLSADDTAGGRALAPARAHRRPAPHRAARLGDLRSPPPRGPVRRLPARLRAVAPRGAGGSPAAGLVMPARNEPKPILIARARASPYTAAMLRRHASGTLLSLLLALSACGSAGTTD